MKKNLLSIISAITLLSSAAIAQPALTATGINPVIGDVYTFKYGTGVNPGNPGASQTWTLIPTTTNTTVIYNSASPSSTPYASSFTQSNFCYHDGNSYIYYNTSSTALKNQGMYSGLTLSYSDAEDFLHYPFNLGNTYSDPWAVTFVSGITFVRTGTTTVTYDGYGSLTLASGTYNNVVRVHFQQVYSDVYSGGTINYNNDEYMWYLNGNHQPIASTYTLTNDMSGPTQKSVILSNIATSVYEHDNVFSSISSYPNPAVNEINFNLNSTPISSIDIIDIAGKNVYSESLTKDNIVNYIKINTSDFKDGIYFAKFTTQDGQIGTKKISIIK